MMGVWFLILKEIKLWNILLGSHTKHPVLAGFGEGLHPKGCRIPRDPVTLCTGISYDRENIEKWIDSGNSTCPVTNQPLRNFDLIPNHAIRKMIQDWCVDNKNYGIERVPTPRIPIDFSQVSEICSRLMVETQRGNEKKCRELVGRVRILAKESERNKKCIVECGTGSVFATCFEIFSNVSVGIWEELLKDLLSALTWMFPIGEEGISKLRSSTSLRCMAWFLKGEDLSARQNAVIVIKELLCYDQTCTNVLTEIQDLAESLFQMVKVPICPSATKASLMSAPLEASYDALVAEILTVRKALNWLKNHYRIIPIIVEMDGLLAKQALKKI
ncbi:hypothetical protein RND71_009275 [Anisodus tanguticus]|uniref:U-box domain-containing protein n=1 Tax=Anisodus tanguticus TaxID=243964 RepID=A0AAE1SHE6_9SOLA|nr:hypothetical protein RND71_009275 [Anisodus tanguticus]